MSKVRMIVLSFAPGTGCLPLEGQSAQWIPMQNALWTDWPGLEEGHWLPLSLNTPASIQGKKCQIWKSSVLASFISNRHEV